MAKFQAHVYGATSALYYSVRNKAGAVLKDNGTFIDYDAASAVWATDCLFSLTQQGSTGLYLPEDEFEEICTPTLDPGEYTVAVQEGIAYGAPVIAFGILKWDGEDFPESVAAGDEMDLVDAPNATAVTAIQDGLAVPGDEMDLVDAPNATAVTAIQGGLAVPGDAMTLTEAYDAAKTAAQAGDEMDLVDAPNATAVTAIQGGLAVPGDAMTLTEAYDAAKTAAQAGDEMDLVDAPNTTAVTAIVGGVSTKVDDVKTDTETIISNIEAVDTAVGALSIPTVGEIRAEIETPGEMLAGIESVIAENLDGKVSEIELDAPTVEEIADEIEGSERLLYAVNAIVADKLDAAISTRSDFDHLTNSVTVGNPEDCKADITDILALAQKLDPLIDGDEDRFTSQALSETPAGDATSDKQDEILAAIEGQQDATTSAIASAVMEKVVDGDITVETALKALLAFATGGLDVIVGPPRQYVFKDKSDESLFTITFNGDGSGREGAFNE